jgi:hypothetical protein
VEGERKLIPEFVFALKSPTFFATEILLGDKGGSKL